MPVGPVFAGGDGGNCGTGEQRVQGGPDREADGMRTIALIQANKNCTSKERDEKRGLIYYRRGRK